MKLRKGNISKALLMLFTGFLTVYSTWAQTTKKPQTADAATHTPYNQTEINYTWRSFEVTSALIYLDNTSIAEINDTTDASTTTASLKPAKSKTVHTTTTSQPPPQGKAEEDRKTGFIIVGALVAGIPITCVTCCCVKFYCCSKKVSSASAETVANASRASSMKKSKKDQVNVDLRQIEEQIKTSNNPSAGNSKGQVFLSSENAEDHMNFTKPREYIDSSIDPSTLKLSKPAHQGEPEPGPARLKMDPEPTSGTPEDKPKRRKRKKRPTVQDNNEANRNNNPLMAPPKIVIDTG